MDILATKLAQYGVSPALAELASACARMAQDLVLAEQQAQQASRPAPVTPPEPEPEVEPDGTARLRSQAGAD